MSDFKNLSIETNLGEKFMILSSITHVLSQFKKLGVS